MSDSLIVMGVNDHRHCLDGWHVRETDARNGVCYRWTGVEAVFLLKLQEGVNVLRFMISSASALTARPAAFSVLSTGTRIGHYCAPHVSDLWTIAEVPLGSPLPRDATLTIRSERLESDGCYSPDVFIPDRHLHNGDHRAMGVMVAAIRCLPG